MKYFLKFVLIPVILLLLFCSAKIFAQESPIPFTEIYRIEVYNKAGGQIAVSQDNGDTWKRLGRVMYPCQKTNEDGYTASKWAKIGSVAASAINAIHIKTDTNAKNGRGVVFSLVPLEMQNPPGYYNSFLSPDSSIYTDIPAGQSIFGGGYSPFVGNPIEYIRGTEESKPIEAGYVPKLDDVLFIKVLRPSFYPESIIFENKFGGAVRIDFGGGNEIVVGEVLKPVQGVGRFSGTQFAGTGRIRANHTGVIDISTCGIGKTGGFQIIPSIHGMSPEMGKARTMTQWMVVGPTTISGEALEGQAPLFSYYLQPKYMPMDLDSPDLINDLLGRFIVDVKLSGSDQWQPMPSFWIDPDLNKPLPEWANTALKNVTHIRILFPVEVN